jgi:hypothetical protein
MDARRKSGGQVPQVLASAERSPKSGRSFFVGLMEGASASRGQEQGQQDDQGAGQKVGCTYLC